MKLVSLLLHDNFTHASHDGSTYTPGNGQCHKPRQHNVAEDWPVDVLTRSEVADENDGADFAVCCTNGNADVWCNQHSECGADLDAETAAIRQHHLINVSPNMFCSKTS